MVMDIARAVGRTEQVDVLATDTRGEEFLHDGVQFLQRSLGKMLVALPSCLSFSCVVNMQQKYKMGQGSLIRLCYYWLMTGYVRSVLKRGNYDVVHIHGCGFATELWMQVCKECSQKFVVTLHGLNSFSETVKLEPAGKQYERDFLRRVVDGEFPITVISSGMKRLIQKAFNAGDCKNIIVVCNSFNIPTDSTNLLVRKKYSIPDNAKVILYVGNISQNKNQVQMVEAYELLPKELQKNTWVLFCGRPSIDGRFEDIVKNKVYSDHLVLCGAVEKTEISNYYKEVDGVALLSFTEGFGLSLVEGMHFGLPCMMFKDMDAFEDIYDDNAMLVPQNREDSAVAHTIESLLTMEWDKNAIREYSKKFESKAMAEKYIDVYKMICI